MCVRAIDAVPRKHADAEQPTEEQTAQPKMNSTREERLERLAREWVPHPTYWGGDPMHVPWLFPAWPERG